MEEKIETTKSTRSSAVRKKPEIKESLLEIAFAEIMPEVEFVDFASNSGGNIAGGARKKLEKRLKRSVVSKNNYLKNSQNKKIK